jgi:hypothetical protein
MSLWTGGICNRDGSAAPGGGGGFWQNLTNGRRPSRDKYSRGKGPAENKWVREDIRRKGAGGEQSLFTFIPKRMNEWKGWTRAKSTVTRSVQDKRLMGRFLYIRKSELGKRELGPCHFWEKIWKRELPKAETLKEKGRPTSKIWN